MIHDRKLVLVVVLLQVGIPLVLLLVRLAAEGLYPVTSHRYGWQMFSSVPESVVCERLDRCR